MFQSLNIQIITILWRKIWLLETYHTTQTKNILYAGVIDTESLQYRGRPFGHVINLKKKGKMCLAAQVHSPVLFYILKTKLSWAHMQMLRIAINTLFKELPPWRPGLDSLRRHVSLGTSTLVRTEMTLVKSFHKNLVFQLGLALDLIQSRMQIRNELNIGSWIRNRNQQRLRRSICP